MMLSEFVSGYIVRRDVSSGYADQLRMVVAGFSRQLGYTATLGDLTSEAINRYLQSLKESDYAAETRKSRRRMLLSLASDAAQQRLIEPLAREMIARVKTVTKLPDGVSREQAAHIVASVLHRGGPHERWLRYRYSNLGVRRRDWWAPYLMAAWDTGAPSDLRELRRADLREGGKIYTVRKKTGKPLRWQLAPRTVELVEYLLTLHREDYVFPLFSDLRGFRRDASHIIQVVAGLRDKSLGGFRSGAGTDAELTHGAGAGRELLGNTEAIFSKHYAIPYLMERDIPAPRPLEV